MSKFPNNFPPIFPLMLSTALLLFVLLSSSPAQAQQQIAVTELEEAQMVTGFVATGSDSPHVLCTINENAPGLNGVRLSGLTLLCRQRQVDFGEGPKEGVAIVVALPGHFRAHPDEGIEITLTVLQQGARLYGPVESCQGQCW